MNPRLGHSRRPRAGRRPPGAGRAILWLAAAAVIALAAPAEAQQAAGSTYGPVRPAETLSQLASRFRGEARVDARQAMIAILRANPGAFVEGNINALRAGVTLRVPTRAEMEAVTPGEAAAEFARHEEAWRNRRRTGSAAPGPAPPAPQAPRPTAAPAAEGTPEGGPDASEELRKARETVSDLRERIAERDEAIEDLLVQLAAVQRELQQLRAEAEPAPSGGSGAPERGEQEAAGGEAAPAASWLPVSPLVLGSSLIVLLVLIVVVTLLRQRGEAEETLPEEPFDEGGEDEDAGAGRHDGAPRDPGDELGDERTDREAGAEEALEAEGREPASPRTVAASAVAAATAAVAATETAKATEAANSMEAAETTEATEAGAAEHVLAADVEGREEEAADLPIGMDLDGEDQWDAASEGSAPDRPDPPDPGEPPEELPEGLPGELPEESPGFGRRVEVGELDRIDLDGDPAPGPPPEVSIDLGEGDDPTEGGDAPGRARPGGARPGGRARRGRRK